MLAVGSAVWVEQVLQTLSQRFQRPSAVLETKSFFSHTKRLWENALVLPQVIINGVKIVHVQKIEFKD